MSSLDYFYKRLCFLTEARQSAMLPPSVASIWSKTRSGLEQKGVSSGNYEIIKFMWTLLSSDELQPTGAILSDEEVQQIKRGAGPGGKRKLLIAAINAKKNLIDKVTNFQEIIDKQMEFYVDREAINRGTGESGRQELYQKQAEARAAAKEAAKELKQKVKQAKVSQGKEAAAIINTAIDEIDKDLSTVFTDFQSSQELASQDPTTIITIEVEDDAATNQEVLRGIQNYLQRFIKPDDIEGEMTVEPGLVDVSIKPESTLAKLAAKNSSRVEQTITAELEKQLGVEIKTTIITPGYEPVNIASAITPAMAEDEELPGNKKRGLFIIVNNLGKFKIDVAYTASNSDSGLEIAMSHKLAPNELIMAGPYPTIRKAEEAKLKFEQKYASPQMKQQIAIAFEEQDAAREMDNEDEENNKSTIEMHDGVWEIEYTIDKKKVTSVEPTFKTSTKVVVDDVNKYLARGWDIKRAIAASMYDSQEVEGNDEDQMLGIYDTGMPPSELYDSVSYTSEYLVEQTKKDSCVKSPNVQPIPNRTYMKPKTIHQAIELSKYGR